jgi:hypothetical protein
MSLFKLAVYGALGYLAYQMFFAEQSPSMRSAGSSRARGQSRAGSEQRSGGQRMSGGGQGRQEQTEEPSGASSSHRVGRGVI